MDVSALASALAGAQLNQVQLALAATMMRMDANQEASIATLIDQAQQHANKLANVGAGIGTNLNISV